MKLALKVNLVLLAVAAIVIELFAVVSTPILENIARAEVLQRARIMMEATAGIRISALLPGVLTISLSLYLRAYPGKSVLPRSD